MRLAPSSFFWTLLITKVIFIDSWTELESPSLIIICHSVASYQNFKMHYNGLRFLGIDTLKYIIKIFNYSYIYILTYLIEDVKLVLLILFFFCCHFIVNRKVYLQTGLSSWQKAFPLVLRVNGLVGLRSADLDFSVLVKKYRSVLM